MAHPYQCLLYCHHPEEAISQVLLAVSGSYIHVFDVSSGQILSSWSPTGGNVSSSQKNESTDLISTNKRTGEETSNGLQPSAKRRKGSPPIVSTESSSTEILVESVDSKSDSHYNPILKLAATSGGHHIVAVTGEDKCLRVLALSEHGKVQQISERFMPKRPCAITISPDDSTIICGDKFGDVYALPLLGQPHESQDTNGSSESSLATKTTKNGSQKFVPSATSLTVHTKRNLQALKQQLEHSSNHEKSEKGSLNFDHKLLSGHISLLTDVACAKIPSNSRSYILTSDRDEHVRVSRGMPQAHIIEGYCQGHGEFVSKLCLIPSKPELLITGGGDDFLILWDWLAGAIKQKIDIRGIVQDFIRSNPPEVGSLKISNPPRPVVSNIQPLEFRRDQREETQTELVMTCEGIPALFLFTLDSQDRIDFRQTYSTEGNVVDVVALSDRISVIFSMDNIYKRSSTLEIDPNPASRPLIDVIHFSESTQHWDKDSRLCERLLPALEETAGRGPPVVPQIHAAKGKSLKDLLYGLGSLRKIEATRDANLEPAGDEDGA